MKGSEIDALLRGVPKYGGVFAFDRLDYLHPGKVYVVNNKPSTHPGEHWIVVDMTLRQPYLFDSFGKHPKYYGLPPMKHWKRALQDPKSYTCGVYCIYYIVHRTKHISPEHMFRKFTRRRVQNDRRVLTWLRRWSRTLPWKGATS